MPNSPNIAPNSSARGYLPPGPGLYRFSFGVEDRGFDEAAFDGPVPMEGTTLDDFMQNLVAGITQLDPHRVFPRWQEEPPNLPDFGTNWCAVGVVDTDPPDGWAYVLHEGQNQRYDHDAISEHEAFTLLCSFYGPQADWYDGLLRSGLQVSQNREVLQLNAMGLYSLSGRVIAPAFIKSRWTRRVDRRVRFHRQIRRIYPVLSLLKTSVNIRVDTPGAGEQIYLYSDSGELLTLDGKSLTTDAPGTRLRTSFVTRDVDA